MPEEIGMPMVKNHFNHVLTPEQEELICFLVNCEMELWESHADIPTNYLKRLEAIKAEMQNHSNMLYRSL